VGSLTYREVGATGDGSRLPPPGYHLLRESMRIGSGEREFAAAGEALMRWHMHRRMGVRMDTEASAAAPGVRVAVGLGVGPLRLTAPCEVVWTVREAHRVGWAYGSLPGHPECGEESFVVERGADGTVRLTVTAFSRPAVWYTRVGGPAVRLFQRAYARRCGRVLRRLAATRTGQSVRDRTSGG
jgi:uncharacterized protein (UPF0548 family)